LLTPDETLEKAKRLPDDKARRQLADDLRKRVGRGEVEFDEREKYLDIAKQIDALCTTPDVAAPEKEEAPQSRIARARAQLINTLEDGDDLGPIIDKLKAMIKLPDDRGRPSASEQNVLAMLEEVRDSGLPEYFRDTINTIIRKVIPRRCATNPDHINGTDVAIGDRGRDDGDNPDRDGFGGDRVHVARRRTDFDKKPTFGDDEDLDHTKPGKRPDKKAADKKRRIDKKAGRLCKKTGQLSRNDGWLTVRRYDPRTGEFGYCEGKPPPIQPTKHKLLIRIEPPKAEPPAIIGFGPAQKPKRKPKAGIAQDMIRALQGHETWNHTKRSDADWRAIARGDGELPEEKPAAGPLVSEKQQCNATKDHAKLAVTPAEIKRREDEARAKAERAKEIAKAVQAIHASRARRGLPPWTDEQARTCINRGVEHRDDHEF
jgi:hypothetical protein